MESQVDTLEPVGLVSEREGISMDVGPSVEKPVGGDTEIVDEEDEEIIQNWSLINLDAPQSADAE